MSGPNVPVLVDLALRAAAAGVLVLLAILLAKSYRQTQAGVLGCLFALGAAAHALANAVAISLEPGPLGFAVVALAAGNSLVFWLFARALFDDHARLRLWQVLLWFAIAAGGVACRFVLSSAHPLRPILAMQAVLFSLMAGAQSLASWQTDLIEPRRRLRLFIVASAAAYSLATSLAGLAGTRTSSTGFLIEAAALLALALVVAASLLRVTGEGLFEAQGPEAQQTRTAPAPALDPAAQLQLEALRRAMLIDRLYRREGLTVAQLATAQKIPEYKLRRLINQGLGYRNFTAFLNHYRIEDVKSRLADPAHAATPILTLALDAGFSSLGPFNRAFKAECGLTPGQFRRAQQVLATTGGPKSTP